MSPLATPSATADVEGNEYVENHHAASKVPPPPRTYEIKWHYVTGFVVLHLGAAYGLYLTLCGRVLVKTILCAIAVYGCTALGTVAGAHRLWSHRTYSARLPLRILLAVFQAMGYQANIFKWVRDHRVHHKYTDTDADPHNSTRGFFYSHIGWLLVRPHPDLREKLLQIDMSDLLADPVVQWQRKYFAWVGPLLTFVLPPLIPFYFWNESYMNSFFVVALLRHTAWLHVVFFINSYAHMWGSKPYDKNISPGENVPLALMALGEGWHNYHHTFPWDYKAAELGNYRLNFATAFIDACAYLGLAYNLKTVDPGMIAKRGMRTGDGTKVFVTGDGTENSVLTGAENAVKNDRKSA